MSTVCGLGTYLDMVWTDARAEWRGHVCIPGQWEMVGVKGETDVECTQARMGLLFVRA